MGKSECVYVCEYACLRVYVSMCECILVGKSECMYVCEYACLRVYVSMCE